MVLPAKYNVSLSTMKVINRKNNGFTMIETLVSLIIISLGILGFALLQVESLKAAKTATERSKAVNFAADMIDRIRTNQSAIASYNTSVSGPGSTPTLCADSATTSTSVPLQECTSAEMAAYDIWQWRTMLEDPKAGFGNGIGEGGITITAGSPTTVTITIEWRERDEDKSYVLTTRI